MLRRWVKYDAICVPQCFLQQVHVSGSWLGDKTLIPYWFSGTFAVHSFNEVTMQCDIMESCEECAPGCVANDTGSTGCAVCYSGPVATFMDGMKVDLDRLGQLRGLARHESR